MRNKREKQIFREVQGARIARWIRDSEAGWLFYGPDGTAFHILTDEAARLEAEGHALVERLLGPGFVTIPSQRTIITVLIGVPLLLGWFLPSNISAVAMPAALLIMIVPMLALNIINDAAYAIALRRWRRGVAARLAADQRGGVPQPIAQKHRRYNLFMALCLCAVTASCGTLGLIMAGVLNDSYYLLHIALLILAIMLGEPARRVDATHLRRKWLD